MSLSNRSNQKFLKSSVCEYQEGHKSPCSATSSDVKPFKCEHDNGEIKYYNAVPVQPNCQGVLCLNNQNASAVPMNLLPMHCIKNSSMFVSYASYPYILCQPPQTYVPTYQIAWQSPLVFHGISVVQSQPKQMRMCSPKNASECSGSRVSIVDTCVQNKGASQSIGISKENRCLTNTFSKVTSRSQNQNSSDIVSRFKTSTSAEINSRTTNISRFTQKAVSNIVAQETDIDQTSRSIGSVYGSKVYANNNLKMSVPIIYSKSRREMMKGNQHDSKYLLSKVGDFAINNRRCRRSTPTTRNIVEFETTRRLTVRQGRDPTSLIVGDLLMNSNNRGCKVWANQAKGCRVRIIGVVGFFLRAGTEEKCELSMIRPNVPFGWVTDRCRATKVKWLIKSKTE